MAKRSLCAKRAAHRKAQAKHVAKSPAKQAKRVADSKGKGGGGTGKSKGGSGQSGSKSKGKGQHGSTIGRPRKKC